ncbi:MAG: nucleotidyl transferase AbiEii/AbiGii toxin family protein [Planctomycetaceae bacterium]|jgi:predicted nucleotidyltransferase component of viral defense system|nr:nucleotidyl transferase AbiEii/AbiGii toxin family protein [Planctomycetaceae bacterium]
MIPEIYIENWKKQHPWKNEQVEQDLILSRAIVEIFSDELLRKSLVFRGGTALHKLFIHPQIRYSEDIDLIQINREPINPVLKRIRERLSFLGTKRTVKQHIHNNTMIYRFDTEILPVVNMRLKIEINTREHLNVLGLQEIPFEVQNEWFSGICNITAYKIEELLGSKLKALYGRKKGRDLFDLYWALTHLEIDNDKLLHCNKLYYENEGQKQPTFKQFLRNMEEKLTDNEFTEDIFSVLKPEVEYNQLTAWELVKKELIERLCI